MPSDRPGPGAQLGYNPAMHRFLVFAAALTLSASPLVSGCVMQPSQSEQQLQMQVPGTYVANVDGQQLQLVLNADGTGSVNGQPGTWSIQLGQIILSDGQNSVPASLSNGQLTVHMPEGAVVFVKQGAPAAGYAAAGQPGQMQGAAASTSAQPAMPATKFMPTGTLSGDVVAPAGSGAEFTVPDGWQHGMERQQDGSEAYAINAPSGQGKIVLMRRVLSGAEANQPVSALLRMAVAQMVGDVPVTEVVAPEDLDIRGQRGGRTIVRGNVGGTDLELYMGGVVVGQYGFVVASMYPTASESTMRPAVDTVLVTLKGSMPEENQQLKGQILGCWEKYEGSTDRTGSTTSSRKFGLNADGTYWFKSYSSVNAEGAGSVRSESSEQGRFRVEGSEVITTSDQGEVSSYTVVRQGGRLLVGGDKYLPCSG